MLKITAILLAAGLSSRMKGKNKMFLPYAKTSILQHTYSMLSDSDVDSVIIVCGEHYQRYVNLLKLNKNDRIVQNYHPEYGLTSSIQTGVKAATEAAVMICLADMPLLDTGHYNALINHYKATAKIDNQAIVLPKVKTQHGNPVIFSEHYREEILNEVQPNGCKSVITLNKSHLVTFKTDDSQFLVDIDSPEDYDQIINDAQ